MKFSTAFRVSCYRSEVTIGKCLPTQVEDGTYRNLYNYSESAYSDYAITEPYTALG
jgi:hypothetical protein